MPNLDVELQKLYSVQAQIQEEPYHQIIPSLSSPEGGIFDLLLANQLVEKILFLNSVFERLWPINRLSTNIFVVGQKVEAFHG